MGPWNEVDSNNEAASNSDRARTKQLDFSHLRTYACLINAMPILALSITFGMIVGAHVCLIYRSVQLLMLIITTSQCMFGEKCSSRHVRG